MAMKPIEKDVLSAVRELAPNKQLEVLDFARFLKSKDLPRPKLKSLRGLWKHLGVSLSEEDIAEARKEIWGNFLREHSSTDMSLDEDKMALW